MIIFWCLVRYLCVCWERGVVVHGLWLGIGDQMCWFCRLRQEGLFVDGGVWLQWQAMVSGAIGCFWHGIGICRVRMWLKRDVRNLDPPF